MGIKIDSSDLRTFVYINTNMVNDYLSSIGQNHVKTHGTEKSEKDKSLGIDKGIQAKKGSVTSEESILEYRAVDSANFNLFYNLLESNSIIKYHEAFDNEIWNNLIRKDFIDTFVDIRLPNFLEFAQLISEISPYMDLFSQISDKINLDDKAKASLSILNTMNKNEKIQIIMNVVDDNDYKFFGEILLEYLKVDRSQLKGEYNVVGKIKKKIQKDKPFTISFAQGLREKNGSRDAEVPEGYEEVIKYPAAELDIIAIYS